MVLDSLFRYFVRLGSGCSYYNVKTIVFCKSSVASRVGNRIIVFYRKGFARSRMAFTVRLSRYFLRSGCGTSDVARYRQKQSQQYIRVQRYNRATWYRLARDAFTPRAKLYFIKLYQLHFMFADFAGIVDFRLRRH